jgi:ADP-heptose:LPS heptosyltransferase
MSTPSMIRDGVCVPASAFGPFSRDGLGGLPAGGDEPPPFDVAPLPPRWAVLPGSGPPAAPRRVLIHQSRFRVGDAMWLTPLLRAVRRAFPEVEVTVVASPLAVPVLARNPHVSEVAVWDPRRGSAERCRVIDRLAASAFDTALFVLARREKSRWMAEEMRRLGVACRVNVEYANVDVEDGAMGGAPPDLFTHEVWLNWGSMASPRLLLHVLQPWLGGGAWLDDRRVELPVTAEEDQEAARVLAAAGIAGSFAVVTPAGHSSYLWPPERFAALAARLAGDLGWSVLVEGGPADQALREDVVRRAGHPLVRAATDPLGVLVALLGRASLLVSNDSAPIHAAEAAGAPTLYFAQREKLVHSHPKGDACWALYDDERNCLADVSVEQALGAVQEMARRGLLCPQRTIASIT